MEEKMRIDKFLKVSRIIKRRTVANEACDAGRVLVNDRVVKASYDVKVNDIIQIQFGQRTVKVQVLNLNETVKKENATEMYKDLQNLILCTSLTPLSNLKNLSKINSETFVSSDLSSGCLFYFF